MILALLLASSAAQVAGDATAVALDRCRNAAANASTASQTGCEDVAARAFDHRMNAAYGALMRKLPVPAAQRLRQSQRAWLAFRETERQTRAALYETRQGTMFVPMQAADVTNVVRDRALQLEKYARVMEE